MAHPSLYSDPEPWFPPVEDDDEICPVAPVLTITAIQLDSDTREESL